MKSSLVFNSFNSINQGITKQINPELVNQMVNKSLPNVQLGGNRVDNALLSISGSGSGIFIDNGEGPHITSGINTSP